MQKVVRSMLFLLTLVILSTGCRQDSASAPAGPDEVVLHVPAMT